MGKRAALARARARARPPRGPGGTPRRRAAGKAVKVITKPGSQREADPRARGRRARHRASPRGCRRLRHSAGRPPRRPRAPGAAPRFAARSAPRRRAAGHCTLQQGSWALL